MTFCEKGWFFIMRVDAHFLLQIVKNAAGESVPALLQLSDRPVGKTGFFDWSGIALRDDF